MKGKKQNVITQKDLSAAGFVEFEQDKFMHHTRVNGLKFQLPGFSPVKPKKQKGKKPSNEKIDLFIILVKQELNLVVTPEHKFHPDRKWRMDYAFLEQKIFIEVEGGVHTGGRHTRGKGFMNDMEKYNAAAAMGWKLIRRVPGNLITNETIDLIRKTITG